MLSLPSFCRKNLSWTPSEVDHGVAATTVRILTDTLWYIDGQHSQLSERSCEIPSTFKQFTDFNEPEIFKHKKQSALSLSGDTLSSLFQTS